MAQLAKGQWTEEQAWDWYDRQGWIRGWCGYPSNCTGRVAMWQEYGHAEVAEQIEREFALAQSIGYNAVRAKSRLSSETNYSFPLAHMSRITGRNPHLSVSRAKMKNVLDFRCGFRYNHCEAVSNCFAAI